MKKFFYLLISGIFIVFSTFSFSGCKNNEIEKVSRNLTCYAISAEFDDDKKEISGTEKINYVNNTGVEIDHICLHLYARAFRKDALIKPYSALNVATCFPNGLSFGDISIVNVKVNGEIKNYEIVGEDEDILKINFGFNLSKGGKIEIVIDFVVTIPNSTHRFGYYGDNVNLGNWYPIVCSFSGEEFETIPYYSTGDPFNSEIANYEIEFIYPEKYSMSSSGNVESETLNENKKVIKVSANAVRDFAIVLSCNSKSISSNVGKTKVSYVGYNFDENHDRLLELSKDAVLFFNEKFGEFPYSTLTIVKTPFVYGGMEYPNIVFISDSIESEQEFEKVIVHEIAHQWWYSIVGNDEVNEAWLDESLAEYSTALFFGNNSKYNLKYEEFTENALSSYLLYVDVCETIRGEVNTKMNLPINKYQNDYEYSYMIYVKGVIMFDSLRSVVGEKKLIQGFKKYYEENKFRVATKEDFYRAFKSACHEDLETFFEGYLNGTVIISKIS